MSSGQCYAEGLSYEQCASKKRAIITFEEPKVTNTMKTASEILQSHCHVFDLNNYDDQHPMPKSIQKCMKDAVRAMEEYANQSRWISVKDRLPEENVSVLVFIPGEDDHITTGMFDVSQKWVLLDEYRVPNEQVTYWHEMIEMPIDRSFVRSEKRSEDEDTMSFKIRELQKRNLELEHEIINLKS